MFLSSFPEKYVGQAFEIDCADIEVHGFCDSRPPIFKGPGIVKGDKSGSLRYKVYNQFQQNSEIINYIKRLKESKDPKEKMCRLTIRTYDGIEWTGGWTLPEVSIYQSPYLFVEGTLDKLTTQVAKLGEDKISNSTEVIFSNCPDLPFDGNLMVQRIRDEEVVSASWYKDHHEVKFHGTRILFSESFDKLRLHILADDAENFTPPFVENWLMETMIFMTAKIIQPRMVIRHFERDALVTIRATPVNPGSEMLPPFSNSPTTRNDFWQLFYAYLSNCKQMQQFELLDITRGFYEICLASKGTMQGFLISLALYIESCMNQIFAATESDDAEMKKYKIKVKNLMEYIDVWDLDEKILSRAKGLLSMLNTPSTTGMLDILVKQNIITETQRKIWKDARPFLAHGNAIDFKKEEEFFHIRNYLISMVYRLIYKIIGYKGLVLDYDGEKFKYVDY